MSSAKITRQGVRDLDNDTKRYAPAKCAPDLAGSAYAIIGYRPAQHGLGSSMMYDPEPVYGKLFIKCGCRRSGWGRNGIIRTLRRTRRKHPFQVH